MSISRVAQSGRMDARQGCCPDQLSSQKRPPTPGLLALSSLSAASTRPIATATAAETGTWRRLAGFLRQKTSSFKGMVSTAPSKAPADTTTIPDDPVVQGTSPLIKHGSGGQVFLLGPNGQPRKIPAALLAAGPDAVKQYAADEELGDESLGQADWMRAVVPPIRS